MSIKEEWQLVAHNQDLTPAEGAVAQAIARRIKPGSQGEFLPIRTLLEESVGVRSKATIESALVRLSQLGLIQITKQPRGSRKPSLITWTLECPPDCLLDHAAGNKKASKTAPERQLEELSKATPEEATRPNPQDTTRPNPQDALRSKEIEREGYLSFIEEALEALPEKTERHKELLAGLADPETKKAIRFITEQLALKAEQDTYRYLKAIAQRHPWKFLPKPPTEQAPPDLSHLPPELREAQLRKLERERLAANAK